MALSHLSVLPSLPPSLSLFPFSIHREKINSLIKKWQTLIEAHVEAKTTDGYTLRLFAVAFTKRVPGQVSKAAYAQAAQVRAIRKKIVDIIKEKVEKNDLKELVKLL
eukprot:evm.model.NODE_37535_length_24537_cov_23.534824.6